MGRGVAFAPTRMRTETAGNLSETSRCMKVITTFKRSFPQQTHMANEAQHNVPAALIGPPVINTIGSFCKRL